MKDRIALSLLHGELLALEAEIFEINDPIEVDEQGLMATSTCGSTTSTTSSCTSTSGTSSSGTSCSCGSTSTCN